MIVNKNIIRGMNAVPKKTKLRGKNVTNIEAIKGPTAFPKSKDVK
jgi:hypothetical protein